MKSRRKSIIQIKKPLNTGLCLKREAVGALYNGRIGLVSAHLNLVERAVVLAAAVMLAVVNGAANVLVCKFSSHNKNFLS